MNGKPSFLDIQSLSSTDLLSLHAKVSDELRRREIMRTANNPTGDLGEYLFCKAFGWIQERNSKKGFDALSADGTRYQIKARRIIKKTNGERQLSIIRNIEEKDFDFLAGILFTENYAIARAAIIPCQIVIEKAKYTAHANGHTFFLTDDIWSVSGVRDVTEELRAIKL